nr:hypothetical protein [Caldimonas sp.]
MAMIDRTRRALLATGGAAALAPLGGCALKVPDPLVPDLMRNRAYDSSAVDAMSSAAQAAVPPALGSH